VGASAFVPPPGIGFPVSATWQGQVWLPAPGAYGFRAVGAALRLDDQPIADEEPRTLAAGWHPIRLSTTFADAAHQVALEWKPPGETQWAAVPRTILQTHPQTHGLLGRYFGRAIETSDPTPIAGTPDYARVDTALSFDYLPPWDDTPPPAFAASPSTMEWTGTVDLSREEGQAIRLEATTPTQVFIDGALVLAAKGQREGERVDAYLPALKGRVPLLVRSVRPATDGGTFWKLRLLWQEPGGAWSAFAAYQPNGGS